MPIYVRRPLVAVNLSQRDRQTHVVWATTHLRWNQRQWNTVLFTDQFRSQPENVIQRDHYGSGSVMIWGEIRHYGKTNRVTVNEIPNSQPY
jgi:hypothetical protein